LVMHRGDQTVICGSRGLRRPWQTQLGQLWLAHELERLLLLCSEVDGTLFFSADREVQPLFHVDDSVMFEPKAAVEHSLEKAGDECTFLDTQVRRTQHDLRVSGTPVIVETLMRRGGVQDSEFTDTRAVRYTVQQWEDPPQFAQSEVTPYSSLVSAEPEGLMFESVLSELKHDVQVEIFSDAEVAISAAEKRGILSFPRLAIKWFFSKEITERKENWLKRVMLAASVVWIMLAMAAQVGWGDAQDGIGERAARERPPRCHICLRLLWRRGVRCDRCRHEVHWDCSEGCRRCAQAFCDNCFLEHRCVRPRPRSPGSAEDSGRSDRGEELG
jgi:hypothetical protein